MRLLEPGPLERLFNQVIFQDDFTHGVIATGWTLNTGDITPAIVAAGIGGQIKGTHSTTDNDAALAHTAVSPFVVSANKPIEFLMRFACGVSAATTNVGNWFVGLVNSGATLTDVITDNGAGLLADFTGAGVYKLDSGATGTESVLRCATSVSTTQTLTATATYPAVGTAAGAFMTVGISVFPKSITEVETTFYFDADGGFNLKQLLDTNGRPIKHRNNYTASDGLFLKPIFFSKQGNTTASQGLLDFVSVTQTRF